MSTPKSSSPDPNPRDTTGLEPGGGVPPGETPPQGDQISGAGGGERKKTPNMGPISGNRTPMIVTLAILAVVVLSVLIYGVAEIAAYLSESPGGEQSMPALVGRL